MSDRQPVMLMKDVYARLSKFVDEHSREIGRKASFSEAVGVLLKRVGLQYFVDVPVRNYILRFLSSVTVHKSILGVILFGSVATGTYEKYSDIDLAFLSSSNYLETLDLIESGVNETEEFRKKTLTSEGLFMNVSPLILRPCDSDVLNPIYFDLIDYGILLFERDLSFTRFLDKFNKIPHSRYLKDSGEVLIWKT